MIVSEVFYSIQGEGRYSGTPAVFLRLGGCNLLCEGAGWRCDTIEVWKKGRKKEFGEVLSDEMIEHLKQGAHLVITGGEPMLQQEVISEYVHHYLYMKHNLDDVFIEIETNGTICPSLSLLQIVKQWNVSFKLSNSGMPYSKRINEVALGIFNMQANADFKIVISKHGDFAELILEHNIDLRKVYLMPAGSSREELEETRKLVAEICKQNYLKYSERLHVGIWNLKTGV